MVSMVQNTITNEPAYGAGLTEGEGDEDGMLQCEMCSSRSRMRRKARKEAIIKFLETKKRYKTENQRQSVGHYVLCCVLMSFWRL